MQKFIINENLQDNELEQSVTNKFTIQKQKLIEGRRFFQKKRDLFDQLVSGHMQILSNNN